MTSDATFAAFLDSLTNAATIPSDVHTAVAQHSLELCTCLLAGASVAEMQPVLQIHARRDGAVAVPTTSVRSELALAAAATAALSHAAEMDPIHAPTVICPAAVTIPAALAVAQKSRVSGLRYVSAICGGYEVAVRTGRTLNSAALLAAGWWPTAVCGSMAAAITAAICMGLEGEQLRDAMGLAAVHAGGLAIGGTSAPVARNLLCAHTVRIGVDAALAARSGVEGPRDIFTGSRNILTAFGRNPDASPLTAALGQSWAVLETSLKTWPCALQAQSALDALTRIMIGRKAAGSVQSIEIRLPAAMQRIVDRPGPPNSRWAAAASLQFLAAALLIDDDLLESRMGSTAGRTDARILELMQRIHVTGDASLDSRYPQEWPSVLTLRDAGGEVTAECAVPPGHPSRRMSFSASDERFRRHATPRLAPEKIEGTISFLRSLEAQSDVGQIIELLHPQPVPRAP